MAIKVAINGFGRIGRLVFRSILEVGAKDIEVVAVNDRTNAATLAYLLKYDSNYGVLPYEISVQANYLCVDVQKVSVLSKRYPPDIPWRDLGVEVVVDATGKYRSFKKAQMHLKAGAKKVIISAPPEIYNRQSKLMQIKGRIKNVLQGRGDTAHNTKQIPVFVIGINEEQYNPRKDHIVSSSSCTVNCAAPIINTIHRAFGIKAGFITTTHSYSNANCLVDSTRGSLRMSRAAGVSIISDYHQVGKDISFIMPELSGKLIGHMFRVPVSTVSLLELCLQLEKRATKEEVVRALRKAAEGDLKEVLGIRCEPLVSVDFKKNPFSAVVDIEFVSCMVNMVRVLSWYDNEWGYACRIVDLIKFIARKQNG